MTQAAPFPQNRRPTPRIPKQALIALIQTISGVQVQWVRDPRVLLGLSPNGESAWVLLSVGPVRNIGGDELRGLYDSTNNQNVWLQLGDRSFTLKCAVRSMDATLEGADLCERIRFGIRTATARAIFVPQNLALQTIQPNVPTPFFAAGQFVDGWQLDIRMGWRAAADPVDPGEGGYIQTVNGTNIVPITTT